MRKLDSYTASDLADLTLVREGETKLGQKMHTISSMDELAAHPAKFVLFGLPEDIGVRANGGKTGAADTWVPTLKALCNIQSTDKLIGEEVLVLGHLDFSDELAESQHANIEQLRNLVSRLDEQVCDLLKTVFEAGKVPIIIGGGHNNAYPILKALAQTSRQAVNTINIDAHADFRALEGRHSGNGFSYAFADGYLNKYAVLGLHENYNSQFLINELNTHPDRIAYTFFEDFLTQKTDIEHTFNRALNFTEGVCGLEIDVDSIAGVSASAATPSGFSAEQIRLLIYQTKSRKMAYLHLCEGIAQEQNQVAKLLSFLISDFIKAQG